MANIKSTEQNNKISVKSTTANSTLNVRPTNLNGKVTANTGVETNTFGIKDNMSEYYARLSQDFASGEGIINGVDYSSKHYAHLSKEYAEIAEQQKNSAISSIAGFNDLAETAEKNLAQARLDYIEAINDTGDSAVVMVETTRDEAVATVEETKENAIESIKKDADAIINRVGLNMFDTVVKDHILTYEESKGLALQGTWVYKEAIAGERCGYPDFYNKCLEEYKDSENQKQWLKSNVNYVGSVIDNQGVLSGFSTANYAQLPVPDVSNATDWEMVYKFKLTSALTATANIIAGSSANQWLVICVTSDSKLGFAIGTGSAWSITEATALGNTILSLDKDYWVKLVFTGQEYVISLSEDGQTYNVEYTYISSEKLPYDESYTCNLGLNRGSSNNPWLGSIDLNESYIDINGARWWTGTETATRNPNGHLYYDIGIKELIDDIFGSTGMAWMYGIDQENERIFLPRNVWFEQMSMDDVGKAVEAGLPTHTHARGTMEITGYFGGDDYSLATIGGAFSNSSTSASSRHFETTTGSGKRVDFKASKSWTGSTSAPDNTIYSNSDTVQPNAVKKLLYICVGNQVADTSWVDVVTQVANGAKDIEDKRVQSLSDIEQDRKQALTDLTNKENAGISALANASNALRTTQITNCLLEVPQRIKYTLEDGTLTIKAGSVVIIPYGTQDLTADYPVGSKFVNNNFKVYDTQFTNGKFFVWTELQVDCSASPQVTDTNIRMVYVDLKTSNLRIIHTHISGDGIEYTGTSNQFIYHTDTNIVTFHESTGDFVNNVESLPICRVKADGVYSAGSIDQVFNGMGYIGSTAWLDKGVKGLISNGRNKDGSLNNIEFETSSIVTRTTAGTENEYYFWCYRKDTNSFNYAVSSKVFYQIARPSGTNFRWYNPETNIWQVCGSAGNLEIRQECPIWYCSLTNGVISNFQPKQPFRAVDCSQVDGQWVDKYAQLSTTLTAGTYTLDLSTYLPNNGYIYEILCKLDYDQNTNGTNVYASLYSDIITTTCLTMGSDNNFGGVNMSASAIIPARNNLVLHIAGGNMSEGGGVTVHGYRRLGTNA